MTPLSNFIEPLKERAKLLKKEKRSKWLAKNREFVNANKRTWRAERKQSPER
jgi:hypothetical protein